MLSFLIDMRTFHVPVMLDEALCELAIKPDGIYVDLTFGGGGHSRGILERLGPKGQLWAFDQDPDAWAQAKKIDDDRLYFVRGNFRFFTHFLRAYGVDKVDGILVDLGVSSYQLDTAERGFAARLDGPLDMRMHQQGELTAAMIVNTYGEKELHTLFKNYGDIGRTKRLVSCILVARKVAVITTIQQFKDVIAPAVPPRNDFKFYAKVFQALRMAVNDEVDALHEMLQQIPSMLTPKGRFVAITYHSGEDRPVKNFIKTGNFKGVVLKDIYGNILRPLRPVHRKILRAENDIATNNRSRSAGMRVAVLHTA